MFKFHIRMITIAIATLIIWQMTFATAAADAPGSFTCPGIGEQPVTPTGDSWMDSLTEWTDYLMPDTMLTERVNILVLGTDSRPGDNRQYGHTDAIILVSIDPVSKTANALSIPRDLWVAIPGQSENRINQAYRLGEIKKHPGGGPALVKETIAANFGIEIDHYILVDFEGFTHMVDTLDGIEVCVPRTIDAASYYGYPISGYDLDNYASQVSIPVTQTLVNTTTGEITVTESIADYEFLYIEAGYHTLDGDTALRYARSRAAVTADFARVQQQQQVILAMLNKALQGDVVFKLPDLWDGMATMVDTDLTLAQVVTLAYLGVDIYTAPFPTIQMTAISHDQTLMHRTDSGASVLLPNYDTLTPLIERMFGVTVPVSSGEIL